MVYFMANMTLGGTMETSKNLVNTSMTRNPVFIVGIKRLVSFGQSKIAVVCPNYAIKGTSVETLDSSELSSSASVPYFGC